MSIKDIRAVRRAYEFVRDKCSFPIAAANSRGVAMTAEAISELVCGADAGVAATDDYTRMCSSIRHQVRDYAGFVFEYRRRPKDKEASYFLPLALRSVMESSCSSVLARIDPFRVLYAAKAQLSPTYDKAAQQASSLKWSGDFVVADKQKPQKEDGAAASPEAKKEELSAVWDPTLGREKLPRALFSPHMYEVLWGPAHKGIVDWAQEKSEKTMTLDALASMPLEDLRKQLTVEGAKLYSELSKGIHPEFLIQRRAEFDEPTLLDLTERSLVWVMKLSALSHFSQICNSRIDKDLVANLISKVEAEIK